ncbi:MAG: hypothetical protein UV38_C0003G0014 [candidate division TM6 bacterium GW2011_GWE2_42_60]|nr:MAG: hypothetical protein UV38_C0003G0014 [candidate division TM6 bacterium GW2011_GWE2_42_60]HBY05929.1 addiction module toxin RelE [Candidatus Dependentiae bacterium]
MQIFQTSTFTKQLKKLHKTQKIELDEAVKTILKNPDIGEAKKGDLSGIRVYKFKMTKQLTLLAYECNKKKSQIVLLAFGSHENFYIKLKQ